MWKGIFSATCEQNTSEQAFSSTTLSLREVFHDETRKIPGSYFLDSSPACFWSGAALAQERLPYRGGPGQNPDQTGARFIKAGALLLATFDANKDLIISPAEIEEGARLAFVYADADGSGELTPLEQRAWAGRVTSDTDVIANPSLFPSAIPGMVTADEFVIGLVTFAQRFEDDAGQVLLSNLTFEPSHAGRDSTGRKRWH